MFAVSEIVSSLSVGLICGRIQRKPLCQIQCAVGLGVNNHISNGIDNEVFVLKSGEKSNYEKYNIYKTCN